MRRSVRRGLLSAAAVTVVGASAFGFQGLAHAVPAAGYRPPGKPLYVGQSGAAVRSVQRRLNQLRYYAGPDDGRYGQDLLEAAWAFRAVQGLRMNATTAAQPINRAFEKDLVHPRQPYVRERSGPASRIEINQHTEVMVLYAGSRPEWIFHVSTGGGYYFCTPHGGPCGFAVTPDGEFYLQYRVSGWQHVPLGEMFNPIYFHSGVAIHGDIPVPWYPASHGCVRMWMDGAEWFWRDVSIGGPRPTPVFIWGRAPYQLGYFGQ
jgi:L,D-transpeptidase catalytic domain/Putative peptidoglycan binding domain